MGIEKKKQKADELKLNQRITLIALNSWLYFFGLKAFYSRTCPYLHLLDNTSNVNYPNSMGGTHSKECTLLAKISGSLYLY